MRLLISVLCAIPLLARADACTVSRVVTDRSGAAVPAADLHTNELRSGRYEISVAKEDFRQQKSQPFDLLVQDRAENAALDTNGRARNPSGLRYGSEFLPRSAHESNFVLRFVASLWRVTRTSRPGTYRDDEVGNKCSAISILKIRQSHAVNDANWVRLI